MKVIMTGGGTGGHVNPALAIANTIRAHQPDAEILFVGTSHGIENKLVPAEGYALRHVEIQGLRRRLTLENLKTAFLMITSLRDAKKLIREFRPDLVIGTGGYVCWPVVRAAAREGIPTALHESNAVPGAAVKMLEKYADHIFVNFEETKQYLTRRPERVIRVGNPVKPVFLTISRGEARRELGIEGKYRHMILSCGGSMGAERVNTEVLALMRDFTAKHPEVLHVHATGAIEYQAAREAFEAAGLDRFENIRLMEYIYDMPRQMAAADLVINRSGAMTLSELAVLAKPCILIPSPNVTNNHQYKNALALEKQGAAVLIQEKELESGRLTHEVEALLSDRPRLAAMSEAIAAFAVPDCGERIYQTLMDASARPS